MKRYVFVQYYKIICVSLIIALFCSVANIVNMYLLNTDSPSKNAGTFDGNLPITIVVDAGHGGEDGGAVGASGTLEKEINLSISKYIKSYFDLSGVNCVLTRENDKMLYGENQSNKKKFYDLKNRYEFCQSFENPVFISVHQNKFPIEKYSGLQVYFSKNNAKSQELAELIQENCVFYIQKTNKRKIKQATGSIYLLNKLECPAVLVECGFLSNENEEKMLKDKEYQKKLAFCIYKSVMEYLQSNDEKV